MCKEKLILFSALFLYAMSIQIITSHKTGIVKQLKALYAYRHLIMVFALRDIRNKYSQTFMGLLWAVIQPLLTLIIFAFFFGVLLKVDTSPIPYPVFVFSGLIFWYHFSMLTNNSGIALIQAQDFINKIYFPKMVLMLAKAMSVLIEFALSLLLLFILMLLFDVSFSKNIIFLPVFLLYNTVIALSIGLWLSALTIRYRDLQHIIPYLIGFGIFITPVFFKSTLIPLGFQFLLYFNPLACVVQGARWAMWGDTLLETNYLWGLLPVFILFLSGLYYFLRTEDNIADII